MCTHRVTTKDYKVSEGNDSEGRFPLAPVRTMTIHKSQGSTIEYMTGDVDRSCKTPNYELKIEEGTFYKMLCYCQW